MSRTPAQVEPVQRAAAFVAARARGDRAAAETVPADFADPGERTAAFCILAELAIRLLAGSAGRPVPDVASDLAVGVAANPAPVTP